MARALALLLVGTWLAVSPGRADQGAPTAPTWIPLHYVRAPAPQSGVGLATEGLSLGMRHRLTPLVVDGAIAGTLFHDGIRITWRVDAMDTATPVVRVGRKDGDFSPVADASYLYRRKGYVQAMLPIGDAASAPQLRLICVQYGQGAPYAYVDDCGTWRGVLALGNVEHPVYVHDTNADGLLADETVMVDVDLDGTIARVECVRPGETVRVGDRAITFTAPSGRDTAFGARVAPAATAPAARDLVRELETAPIRGKAMPAFEFVDHRGTRVTSAELLGRVVLLNFWGAW